MVFQRYRATEQLGKGSFGTVYLAEGRQDTKKYVVKVVDNMRTKDLKVQEIRILLHLKHCNIIEMRDFYTSNAQLCIVMEYADGGDLRGEIVHARNQNATIPEEIISVWIIQVCWALDYLHNMQLIHRDVKPSNIFLLSNRRSVRLGDFGISKILDSVSERDRQVTHETEGRVGTKRYMAPEVLTNNEISCQADIWSVGCVLFELSTLKHPTYEQTGRIFFEWIPDVYSRTFFEIICCCLCEAFDARPSAKKLMDRLIAPNRESPAVRQIFREAFIWQQQQLDMQMRAFQDQMAGFGEYLPSGSVSDGSCPSSSQARAFQVEEQREKGPLLNASSGCRQSASEALHRDCRFSSSDLPKSDLGGNSIESRTAAPTSGHSMIEEGYSGKSNEQVCIAEPRKQSASLNRTELFQVQLAGGCCSSATLQQPDGLQQRHEEQARHSLVIEEFRPCGGTHLACQSEAGLDSLDEAGQSGKVAPGQQRKSQNAMWDGGSGISELRACHLVHSMETIWVAGQGKLETGASTSAGCLRDNFSDVECSDRTLIVAQLASAADGEDRILSERLKLCTGEEATEQVCSDYDIMCHQVDARHSGCCPSDSHLSSCFIGHEAVAKRPSPVRYDADELSIMMHTTELDSGTALPYGRLSVCDTDSSGSRVEHSAKQHQFGTDINNYIKNQDIQFAPKHRKTIYDCNTSAFTDLCLQSNGSHSVPLTENQSTSGGHPDTKKVIEDLQRIRSGIRATLAENKYCIRDSNLELPGLGLM